MKGTLKVVIVDFAFKDLEFFFLFVYSNVCRLHAEGLTNNSSTDSR